MSEENVAILKDAFARFEQEPTPAFDWLAPEVELINFESFPMTRPYHGWDGALAWLADVSEPFDDFRFELVDVLANDDERVVTRCRASGDSRHGGPPIELVWGVVWTFREGKAVRVEGFRTVEEALEAAGLSE